MGLSAADEFVEKYEPEDVRYATDDESKDVKEFTHLIGAPGTRSVNPDVEEEPEEEELRGRGRQNQRKRPMRKRKAQLNEDRENMEEEGERRG